MLSSCRLTVYLTADRKKYIIFFNSNWFRFNKDLFYGIFLILKRSKFLCLFKIALFCWKAVTVKRDYRLTQFFELWKYLRCKFDLISKLCRKNYFYELVVNKNSFFVYKQEICIVISLFWWMDGVMSIPLAYAYHVLYSPNRNTTVTITGCLQQE